MVVEEEEEEEEGGKGCSRCDRVCYLFAFETNLLPHLLLFRESPGEEEEEEWKNGMEEEDKEEGWMDGTKEEEEKEELGLEMKMMKDHGPLVPK